MNERIQQLYKQAHITREKQVRAGGWDNDREPFEYRTVTETDFDPEKFAELIVQECIEVANKTRPGMEIKSNTHLTADAIKQHFGLELRQEYGVEP